MRIIGKLLGGAFIVAVLLLLGGLGGLYYLNRAPQSIPEEGAVVTIESGQTVLQIARDLTSRGILRSPYPLLIASRLKGTGGALKSGSYRIPPGSTGLEVHDLLVSGRLILTRITIPEGWTLRKVAGYLEEKGITESAAFIDAARDREILERYGIMASSAEGFLSPDTYFLAEGLPAGQVVGYLIEQFFRKLENIYPDYRQLSWKQLFTRVVVASIVEREYRIPEEAPLMASVFFNRLDIRMHLQSCATVEYVITEELNRPHPEILTYRDLDIDSPYNTYLHLGMPPGPISNPGETALRAAFSPAETDYLFFLLRDAEAGKHYFSKKLDEHNQARNLYLKKVAPGK